MKKFTRVIGVFAALAIMTAQMPVLADTAESAAMEQALIAVKSKVYIPEELTEFSSNSTTRNYSFEWYDEDKTEHLNVSCNKKGQIVSYYMFSDTKYDYSQKIPEFSREEAQRKAEEFLVKTVPETRISENDCFIYENSYAYSMGYTFNFIRYHDGVEVLGNRASVNVELIEDEMKVTSMTVNMDYGTDYDTPFEEATEEITNPVAAYKQVFPAEMIYMDNYKKARAWENDGEEEIRLVYRINDNEPGYISAYTGEMVRYKSGEAMPLYSESMKVGYAAMDTAAAGNGLSRAEIEEIETIASLKSKEECMAYLKTVPMIKMDEAMTETGSGVWLTDKEHGEYRRDIDMACGEETRRFLNVSFDAVRGTLVELYNSIGNVDNAGVEEIKEREEEVTTEFLEYVLGDTFSEFMLDEQYANRRYVRVVNGVPYINDTIYIDYNAQKDMIHTYSFDYNYYGEFADPALSISAEAAYDAMLGESPVEKVYIYDGEKYRLVYGLANAPLIDALTGKSVNENYSYDVEDVAYGDISGHWCENAVNELQKYGIAFNADALRPDEAITQADLLRLFLAGVQDRSVMMTDIENVYSRCYSAAALTKEERNDDAVLSRERAFMYMVRLLGHETVAKLPDIYKVKYADGDKLSEGMLGYAAILSGMGIINGDGSEIRPVDNITRAEALTMVYNYLTSR